MSVPNTKRKFSLGPAILVTAAFIGPGTVFSASRSGANYGFVLLWAVGFSVIATIILQEMAARLGIVTGDGLTQAIKSSMRNPLAKLAVLGLVLIAVLFGNAAYQTGNILGAAKGVSVLFDSQPATNGTLKTDSDQLATATTSTSQSATNQPSLPDTTTRTLSTQDFVVLAIGLIALTVIWVGRFDILQSLLTLLVALMSVLFVMAAIQCKPDWGQVAIGFVPRIPKGSQLFVIALIGTTVVPYNLFLHASAAKQRWDFSGMENDAESQALKKNAISYSRWDTIASVLIGGIVTAAILITASVAFHSIESAETAGTTLAKTTAGAHQVALQLEPALGSWAKTMFAIGLCAAGLTSAITAPIAAGYAASGCFGWPEKLSDWRLKSVASVVVLIGVMMGILLPNSPIETIILAQVANGLLLPIVAVLLLVMANRSDIMGEFRNRWLTNILGVVVIGITILIAFKNFNWAWGKIQAML
ncbi:MAG: Nramp family divalent metal transporter [Mariniblastus sp.]